MKILFVLPRSPWPPYVGQARLSYYRAQELRKLGHQVHLFCYGLGLHSLTTEQLNMLSLAYDSIEYIDLSSFQFFLNLILKLPSSLFLRKSILAYGFTPSIVLHRFKLFLRFQCFDLVHFYSIRSCPLWSLLSLFEIPYVVDLVDSMSLNFAKRLQSSSKLLKPFLRIEQSFLRDFESNLLYFSV